MPTSHLWADLDRVTDEVLKRVDILVDRGGFVVDSGSPGHLHVYVALAQPVEPAQAAELNRRLARYLDADPSPGAINAHLRPPGSLNWKPPLFGAAEPAAVVLTDVLDEPGWDLEELVRLLPMARADRRRATDDIEAEPVDDEDVPAALAPFLADKADVDDRSARHYNFVGAAKAAGLSDGQVLDLVQRHKPSVGKYGDRVGDQTKRTLGKLIVEEPESDPAVAGNGWHPPGWIEPGDWDEDDPTPSGEMAKKAASSPEARRKDHHVEGPRGLEEVLSAYSRWLSMPDPSPVEFALGGIAANLLPGDPFWGLEVGPASGGKTEVLISAARLPYVYPAATITEPALLSGTASRDKAKTAKGGLLREIGEFGVILCKDFGSVVSMHREARASVLAALREVYDGSWTRHLGVDGGKTLHWEGKVGLIAGCTPAIDNHHAVMGSMGERFVLFRLPAITAEEQARSALAHAGQERKMRAELSQAVCRLFEGLSIPSELPSMTAAEEERLISLAVLAVRCRSTIERDSYSREIELIPEAEAPGRLTLVLARLHAGLTVIGVDRTEAWRVVAKVALDSMPAIRRTVLELLLAEEHLTAPDLASAAGYPTQTARRAMEDLAAHGVLRRESMGKGKADRWSCSDWTRQRWTATVPETSDAPL